MKHLVIAEKPAVARDIAKLLGATTRQDGYIEGPQHDVTWCVGHLVQLASPEHYGYGSWSMQHLPMRVDTFELVANQHTEDQAIIVRELLQDRSYQSVINACDAGREGELIFGLVYQWAQSDLPIQRLWVNSLTEQELAQGFKNLKPGSNYKGLLQAAQARNEADWIVGLNATRAMTLCARAQNPSHDGVLSIGRVQTPTLALIVDRHIEREQFKSKPYWEIWGTFGPGDDAFDAKLVDEKHTIIKFDQKPDALFAQLQSTSSVIDAIEEKEQDKSPPQLFDLTSLQQIANTRFGYSAMQTLEIAQSLYETHKLLSYPRTDSKYLTKSYAEGLADQLQQAAMDLELDPLTMLEITSRTVNDAKVSDHHAIVPTGEAIGTLNEQERNVFELVTRRTLAAFGPSAKVAQTVVLIKAGDHTFKATGSQVLSMGWMRWEKPQKDSDETTLAVGLAEGLGISSVFDLKALKTKPKPKLTEATLLKAMERASLGDEAPKEKNKGIGTPATRASIIETLISRGYVIRDKKHLNPTDLGLMLVEYLRPFGHLTSAQMTGQWEYMLHQIETQPEYASQFRQHIEKLTQSLVQFIDAQKSRLPCAQPTHVCPQCSTQSIVIGHRKTQCIACGFGFWTSVSGVQLTSKQIDSLLAGQTIGPIDRFEKKEGGQFSAMLQLTDKLRFVFDQPFAGTCPACKTQKLRLGTKTLQCACGFGFWTTVFGHKLDEKQIESLLVGQTIGPVQMKNKDNKAFAAKLKLIEIKEEDNTTWKLDLIFQEPFDGICPGCQNQSLMISPHKLTCQLDDCNFDLWRTIGGYTLKPVELNAVLAGQAIGPVKMKNKDNKSFWAKLQLEHAEQKWQLRMIFEEAFDHACPKCNGHTLSLSSHKLKCKSCDFDLWRTTFGYTLDEQQLVDALGGQTIGPVRMKGKENKSFKGKLKLDEQFKWELVFDKKRTKKKPSMERSN